MFFSGNTTAPISSDIENLLYYNEKKNNVTFTPAGKSKNIRFQGQMITERKMNLLEQNELSIKEQCYFKVSL